MKKTLNINLGGIAFIIDENAFEILFNYLEALKKKFDNETERQEILNDIEARIAEMFNEQLGHRKEVLGIEEVEYVIRQMGRPEDIAGEEPSEERAETTTTTTSKSTDSGDREVIKKRLYRDTDDSKVGGVIAGLCHYFGISDPIWVRIAAIVLIPVTSGSIIFVYLLLLIIIPKASTAAEKLQMKGEPININTIEKEVKDAANRFSSTVKMTMDSEGFFQKFWSLIAWIGGAFLRLMAVLLILVSVAALFAVLVGFFAFFILGTTPFNSITHLVVSQSSLISLASIGLLLFLGVPLVAFIYLGLRILVGQGSRMRWLKWVLLTFWLAGLAMILFSGITIGLNFSDVAVKKENVLLMQPAGGNLLVQLADSTSSGWITEKSGEEDRDEEESHFGIVINGKNLDDISSFKIGKPEIELIASGNDSFYIQKVVSARGRNHSDATTNVGSVMYSFMQTDTTLNLSKYFEIPKDGGKYRAQNMTIRLAVPEGKRIIFAENIDELDAEVKGDSYYDDTYFAHTTWTVLNGKVKCLNCDKTYRSQQEQANEEKVEQLEQKKTTAAEKKADEKIKEAANTVKEQQQKTEKSGKDNSHEDF